MATGKTAKTSGEKSRVDNWLRHVGPKVIENGWPIVLVEHASKHPRKYPWGSVNITLRHVQRVLAKNIKAGVGIRCGNLIGLDDDHEAGGAVTPEFLKAVEELKDHFFPKYMARRGRNERVPLRLIRLADDATFKSCNIGKFQILAKGRYFVAFGIHPISKTPYAWLKRDEGHPLKTSIDDCPEYTVETLVAFIQGLEMLEDAFGLSSEHGISVLERIKAGNVERKPDELRIDRSIIAQAVEYIPNDDEWGWDEWNNIMMALWSASNGEDWGLEFAHTISSKHLKYDRDATEKRWQDITNSPPTRIGGGTLLWLARKNGMPNLGPRDWDNYRAVLDRKELFNVKELRFTIKETFNDMFAGQAVKKFTPYQRFLDIRPAQTFSTTVWDPLQPFGPFGQNNLRVWNTCKMPTDYGEQGDIEPWMEVMRNVYQSEDIEIIIKRMAYDVHYPTLKPLWHELLIGDEGVGKSMAHRPLREWFGEEMVQTPSSTELSSGFNSYVRHTKYLEIAEADIDHRVFNNLKDLFASDNRWITVNEKYLRPYKARNVISAWLTSNNVDAASLNDTERRFHVVRARAKRDSMINKGRFDEISKWLDDNWKNIIWHLKNEVEVKEVFGKNPPPATQAMKNLVSVAGRSHVKVKPAIEKIINGCLLFSLKEVHRRLIEGNVHDQRGIISLGTVKKAFLSMGFERAYHGEPIRIGETRVRLWTSDHDYVNAKEETLRSAWNDIQSGLADMDESDEE